LKTIKIILSEFLIFQKKDLFINPSGKFRNFMTLLNKRKKKKIHSKISKKKDYFISITRNIEPSLNNKLKVLNLFTFFFLKDSPLFWLFPITIKEINLSTKGFVSFKDFLFLENKIYWIFFIILLFFIFIYN
jgi:hypothetical protein